MTQPQSDAARASIGARRNPETEAAVLDAAAALIAEAGYGALTMEAVCRRARAGKATLYRWWPSKGHLALALISRAKEAIALPDSGSLRGDLILYLEQVLAQWRGDDGQTPLGPLLRALYAEAGEDPALAAAFAEARQSRWRGLDLILTAARDRGELAPRLTPDRARALIMALPIYLLLTGALPRPGETGALVDDLLPGLTRD